MRVLVELGLSMRGSQRGVQRTLTAFQLLVALKDHETIADVVLPLLLDNDRSDMSRGINLGTAM